LRVTVAVHEEHFDRQVFLYSAAWAGTAPDTVSAPAAAATAMCPLHMEKPPVKEGLFG